jgi:hypothetical protein
MKCDNCGIEFTGAPVIVTHEVREGLTGRTNAYIRNTTTEPLVLCPECAKSLRNWPWFLLVGILAAIAVGLIISLFR